MALSNTKPFDGIIQVIHPPQLQNSNLIGYLPKIRTKAETPERIVGLIEDQTVTDSSTALSRYEAASVVVKSGDQSATILVFGGRKERAAISGSAFQVGMQFYLDDKDGSLKSSETNLAVSRDIPTARYGLSATYCPQTGNVILFGGAAPGLLFTSYSDEVNVFDSAYKIWKTNTKPAGAIPPARAFHAAILVPSSSGPNKILLSGGQDAKQAFSDLYTLNTKTLTWTKLSPTAEAASSPPSARSHHCLVYQQSTKKAYLFGGYDVKRDEYFNDLYELSNLEGDNPTPTWRKIDSSAATGPSVSPRSQPICQLVTVDIEDKPHEVLLVWAGKNADGGLGDAWIYLLPSASSPVGKASQFAHRWVELSLSSKSPTATSASFFGASSVLALGRVIKLGGSERTTLRRGWFALSVTNLLSSTVYAATPTPTPATQPPTATKAATPTATTPPPPSGPATKSPPPAKPSTAIDPFDQLLALLNEQAAKPSATTTETLRLTNEVAAAHDLLVKDVDLSEFGHALEDKGLALSEREIADRGAKLKAMSDRFQAEEKENSKQRPSLKQLEETRATLTTELAQLTKMLAGIGPVAEKLQGQTKEVEAAAVKAAESLRDAKERKAEFMTALEAKGTADLEARLAKTQAEVATANKDMQTIGESIAMKEMQSDSAKRAENGHITRKQKLAPSLESARAGQAQIEDKITQATATKKKLAEELEETTKQIALAEKELAKVERKDQLVAELKSVEQEKLKHATTAQQLSKQAEQILAKLNSDDDGEGDAKVDENVVQSAPTSSQVSALAQTIEKQRATLRTDLEAARKREQELKRQIKEVEKQLETANAELVTSKDSISKLIKEQAEIDGLIQEASAKVANLGKESNELKASRETTHHFLAQLEEEVATKAKAIAEANRSLQSKKDSLHAKLKEWQTHTQALTEREAQAKLTSTDLSAFRATLQLKIQNAKAAVAKINSIEDELKKASSISRGLLVARFAEALEQAAASTTPTQR